MPSGFNSIPSHPEAHHQNGRTSKSELPSVSQWTQQFSQVVLKTPKPLICWSHPLPSLLPALQQRFNSSNNFLAPPGHQEMGPQLCSAQREGPKKPWGEAGTAQDIYNKYLFILCCYSVIITQSGAAPGGRARTRWHCGAAAAPRPALPAAALSQWSLTKASPCILTAKEKQGLPAEQSCSLSPAWMTHREGFFLVLSCSRHEETADFSPTRICVAWRTGKSDFTAQFWIVPLSYDNVF